jgi:hypothetical protein
MLSILNSIGFFHNADILTPSVVWFIHKNQTPTDRPPVEKWGDVWG